MSMELEEQLPDVRYIRSFSKNVSKLVQSFSLDVMLKLESESTLYKPDERAMQKLLVENNMPIGFWKRR